MLLPSQQLGVIVDVAVEGAYDIRAGSAGPGLVGVERVGVGRGDQPHACPSGVGHHRGPDLGRSQGPGQERVGPEGVAEGSHVVTELADLRRCFVHHGQAAFRSPHGQRAEKGVGRPRSDQGPQLRAGQVEAVAGQHEVQTGGVPAPHFEAVERTERHLYRPKHSERARAGPHAFAEQAKRSSQGRDGPSGVEPVVAEGPDGVVQAHQGGVDLLELLRAHGDVPGIKGGFEARHPGVQLGRAPLQGLGGTGLAKQAGQTGHTLQGGAQLGQSDGGGPQRAQLAVGTGGQPQVSQLR